jgi:hypothetical protein
MMTQQLEVSILAAPIAAIDRRALSQAWYSALRMARRQPDSLPARPRSACTIDASATWPPVVETHSPSLVRTLPEQSRSLQQRPQQAAVAPSTARVVADRASLPLSRRIERRFSQSKPPLRRATFSMGRGLARVHVILQTNGSNATLVALCRPEMRGVVARALGQARFALAARGLVVDVRNGGAEECF